jgi:thiol-disulfide isomerase/thioredoxin
MLRRSTLLLLLCACPFLQAQVLADYEVTDISGEKHQVFDILDSGKPIVFYFFFINCLNCNSVTPALGNLYDELGNTNGCFEVLALNVSEDSEEEIAAYAESKNADFPFGSKAANPFTLSFLSQFSESSTIGTPAVLMFAPDHSLIYSGNGINVLSEGPMSTLVENNTQLPCNGLAGLDDNAPRFNLFPNPLSASSQINLDLESAGDYTIKLLDQTGKLLFTNEQRLEHNNTLTLPAMVPGIYFLSLESEDHQSVNKFIKI